MSKAVADITRSSSQLLADNIIPVTTKAPLLTLVIHATEKTEKENIDIQESKKKETSELSQQGYIKYPTYDFF